MHADYVHVYALFPLCYFLQADERNQTRQSEHARLIALGQ